MDISKYDIKHNDEIENGIGASDIASNDINLEEKGTIRRVIDKIFEVPAIPVSLFTGLTSLGYVSILSFYRLYAVEVDLVGAFSLFFIIYSIVLVASRPIAGRIQDNYGDRIICFTGIIAQAPHLPAQLLDNRQRSRATPARSSA